MKSAQCRYRRRAGTSAYIFRHCAVTGFPNFAFLSLFMHANRLLDYR